MNYRNRYHACRVAQVAAFFLALFGLQKVYGAVLTGSGRVSAVIWLFGAVIAGLVASILAAYYGARQDNVTASQEAALDALAKAGRQNRSTNASLRADASSGRKIPPANKV